MLALSSILYSLSEICTIQMSRGFISWCIHLVLIHDIYIYWKQDVYFFTVFYSLYYSQDVCLLHMKLHIYELLGEGKL